MAHLCHDAVVTCEDFRLHQRRDGRNYIAEFIEGLDEECDLITRAGCIQDLVRPKPGFDESLLRDLTVAVNLHRVNLIHLIGHEDCGAYAHFKFASREAELGRHHKDLQLARELIQARFPGIEVRLYFAELEDGSTDRFVIKPVE